jgi:hypothetical protein
LDEALRYALTRKTMGKPIAQHQAVAFKLAEMAAGIEAARLLTWKAAWLADSGQPNTVWAAMAKLSASEHAKRVVAEAVQIFGGAGFCTEFPVEKLMRDATILTTYEGTSEVRARGHPVTVLCVCTLVGPRAASRCCCLCISSRLSHLAAASTRIRDVRCRYPLQIQKLIISREILTDPSKTLP